jgi:hypothetical protein
MGRTHDSFAMQKVVGSSPIIRSRNACKFRDVVVRLGNDGCNVAALLDEFSVNSLRDLGFLRARKRQRHPGWVADCPANQAIPAAWHSDAIKRSRPRWVHLLCGSQSSAEGHPRRTPVRFPFYDDPVFVKRSIPFRDRSSGGAKVGQHG